MNILPPPVLKELATPRMRLGHLLWHGVREYWERLNEDEKAAFSTKFPNWVPTHPSRDSAGNLYYETGAGLDFLYMHNQMICHVNCLLDKVSKPHVEGWSQPPSSLDRTVEVPREYRLPSLTYRSKDDAIWDEVVAETRKLLRPENLGAISLDRLGTTLEYGIHAAMHERFGAYSKSGHLRPGQAQMLTNQKPKWNHEEYDTLLDAYSAHVNPLFWNIHVWIDKQIGNWVAASGGTADFSDAWIGPMHECDGHEPHGGGHDHHDDGPSGSSGSSTDGLVGGDGQPVDEGTLVEQLSEAISIFRRTGMDGIFRPALFVPRRIFFMQPGGTTPITGGGGGGGALPPVVVTTGTSGGTVGSGHPH